MPNKPKKPEREFDHSHVPGSPCVSDLVAMLYNQFMGQLQTGDFTPVYMRFNGLKITLEKEKETK